MIYVEVSEYSKYTPRGGAKNEIQSIYLGWIFCFWSIMTVDRIVLTEASTFLNKINFLWYQLRFGFLFGTPF